MILKNLLTVTWLETTKVAGRLSQPLLGLGLLENVTDETLLSLADPDDADKDGISGRPQYYRYERR